MPSSLVEPGSVWDLVKLVCFVMLAQLCAQFLRSWLLLILKADGFGSWQANNLSYLLDFLVMIVLLYPLWIKSVEKLRRQFDTQKITLRVVLVSLAIAVALRISFWGLLIAKAGFGWTADLPPIAAPVFFFQCPPPLLIGLHLLVMSICVPLIEEIVYRGWFADWFLRFGTTVAVVLSSALFAVMHAPAGLLGAFVFGLFAARLYFSTGSLWGPVIAHAFHNSLLLIDWHCFQVAWNPANINHVNVATGVIGIVIAISSLTLSHVVLARLVTGQPSPGDRAA